MGGHFLGSVVCSVGFCQGSWSGGVVITAVAVAKTNGCSRGCREKLLRMMLLLVNGIIPYERGLLYGSQKLRV